MSRFRLPMPLFLLAACTTAGGKAPPLLPGEWEGIGMTDTGNGYYHRVTVSEDAAGSVVLTTTLGGDTVRAALDAVGDSVALHYRQPTNGTGFMLEVEPGHLEGRWQLDDGRSGWEVLRRRLPADSAPAVREAYAPAAGTIRIGPGVTFPRTDVGHTVLLPPGGASPVGVIVLFDGFRVRSGDLRPVGGSLEGTAPARGVAILRMTTGDPLDFLFTDAAVDRLLVRIDSALATEGLGELPVAFAGLSLAGTRAARAAIRARESGIPLADRLKALVLVDAPLDFARMHASETKARRDSVHPAAAGEADWVLYRLEEALGGPPASHRDAYEAYSPVSLSRDDGGEARALRGLAVRAYHEPDIDWWLEHRGKDYTQINSTDLAGLVNRLQLAGSPAELVTSHRARDGWRHGATPHTWSIVDNADLVAWFLGVAGGG